jgi:hypothetical protein
MVLASDIEADARADDVSGGVDDDLARGARVGVVAGAAGVAELVDEYAELGVDGHTVVDAEGRRWPFPSLEAR